MLNFLFSNIYYGKKFVGLQELVAILFSWGKPPCSFRCFQLNPVGQHFIAVKPPRTLGSHGGGVYCNVYLCDKDNETEVRHTAFARNRKWHFLFMTVFDLLSVRHLPIDTPAAFRSDRAKHRGVKTGGKEAKC